MNKDKSPSTRFRFSDIWLPANRGLLLDIVVFVVNLLLMRLLMGRFVDLLKSASAGDVVSEWVLFLFVLGIFFLPPIGAILKRWQFHLRRGEKEGLLDHELNGCLFGPIPYLIITVIIFVVIQTFILQYVYGDDRDKEGSAMIIGTLLNLPISVINTWLVYRFFTRPKKEPIVGFLKSPLAGTLGDASIFVNMIFYQLLWNLLAIGWFPRPSDVTEFIGRLLLLAVLSLLLYFPPRMFYLSEDIDKRWTWITILLANLPVIVKVMIGTKSNIDW